MFFRILSHLCIVLSFTFLIFAVLDWYNPMMNFTTNVVSYKILLVFCVISLILSIRQAVQPLRNKAPLGYD